MYDGPEEIDLQGFLSFVAKFQAPGSIFRIGYHYGFICLIFFDLAYYYGQRLRKYISRGLIEQATELLIRGCSVNTADGEGMTSLHYAANYNKPKAVEALISFYGLEINRR